MNKAQDSLFDYLQNSSTQKTYGKRYGKTLRGRSSHGGSKQRGRKLERPLSTKKWIHLTLKSDKAKGVYSFLHPKNKVLVESILKQKAKKFHIRLDQLVNVGNHMHLKLKIPSRVHFQRFLKSVTCLIARKVTKAKKGNKFGRFWQGLAFTRVLNTALEVLNLHGYFKANKIEAEKGYEARNEFLRAFNEWVYRERKQDLRSG